MVQAVGAAATSFCSVGEFWAARDIEAEVAPGLGPFVVLFSQDGTDEADQGGASDNVVGDTVVFRVDFAGARHFHRGPTPVHQGRVENRRRLLLAHAAQVRSAVKLTVIDGW